MRSVLLALILGVWSVAGLAQSSSDSSARYYFEPWPLDVGTSLFDVGLSITILPGPLVESEVPAPALDLRFRYGMAERVSMIAVLTTNVVSNIAQFGVQWNDHLDRFSYALGANAIGFYGWLSIEGQFDNNWAYAVAVAPIIRLGYRFDEFSVSSAFSGTYVLAAETKVSDLSSAGPTGTVNDLFCTLAVEQPFLKTMRISLGISIAYSRVPPQSWITVNTIDQYMILPEFIIGFRL
jgi:hypothetical protein